MVNLEEIKKTFGDNRVRLNEPMKLHTSFKIGGPAEFYIEIDKIDDLTKAVKLARKLNIPVFIFGGASNILVSDNGIKGLVIKNNCRRFDVMRMSGRVKNQKIDLNKALVFSESGVLMNQLVRFTIEQGLSGLEYQLGLPGTVGGAVFMNSNFPKEKVYVGDCVSKAKILTKEGDVKEVDNSYFHFAYDKSILQDTGEMVLSVVFKLMPGDKKLLWERGMEAVEYRSKTQPKGSSAGCIFRNISLLEAIKIPTPNQVTSAGYLIDSCGLKGKKIGGAMISTTHANFIINKEDATAKDVIGLIALATKKVHEKFGVNLVMEVRKIGF